MIGRRGDVEADAVAHDIDPAGGAEEGDAADTPGETVVACRWRRSTRAATS